MVNRCTANLVSILLYLEDLFVSTKISSSGVIIRSQFRKRVSKKKKKSVMKYYTESTLLLINKYFFF